MGHRVTKWLAFHIRSPPSVNTLLEHYPVTGRITAGGGVKREPPVVTSLKAELNGHINQRPHQFRSFGKPLAANAASGAPARYHRKTLGWVWLGKNG